MNVPMTYAPRSWFLAIAAMLFGLGLYQFDNWYERMSESWTKTLLDDFEILVMGPGMAALVLVVAENARLRDQAHQHQLEQERERRFQMLGRIAASVAHEVRNPLHNLRLIDEELRAEIPAASHTLIDRMEANLRRLDDAVALAYELAKPMRDTEDAGFDEIALVPLVDAVIAETQGRLGRAPAIDHQRPAEEAMVAVRESALRIVLGNLVRNAFEAGGSGPIAVAYRHDGNAWRLELSNPGQLPEAVIANDQTGASAKPDGLGIGLGIARHLVANFAGRLELANRDGRVHVHLVMPATRS